MQRWDQTSSINPHFIIFPSYRRTIKFFYRREIKSSEFCIRGLFSGPRAASNYCTKKGSGLLFNISGDDLCTEANTCPLQGCDTGKRPHGYGIAMSVFTLSILRVCKSATQRRSVWKAESPFFYYWSHTDFYGVGIDLHGV